MPRDDIHHATDDTQRDRDPLAGPGLPERFFAGPETFRRAFGSVVRDIRRRNLRGVLYTIELTSVGATGHDARADEEALLDSMAEMLVRLFRGTDLVARTGELGFAVVATPVPRDAEDGITRRLSREIEALLRDWRRHGVVTCCAVSQQPVDAGRLEACTVFSGRTRHVLHDDRSPTDNDESNDRRAGALSAAAGGAQVIPLVDVTANSGPPA